MMDQGFFGGAVPLREQGWGWTKEIHPNECTLVSIQCFLPTPKGKICLFSSSKCYNMFTSLLLITLEP